ncbi:MAG: SDR family oxidoreductase [Curvibacter sp.]|nr:SDR family oxidoreductase [Curvibacter sp.]
MATLLIMGASRGLGLELARQSLEAGDRVIATVRNEAARDTLLGLGAEVLTLDLAKPASVSGLAWQLDGEKIDQALYVAGVMDRGNALSPPTQPQFDAVMHANVLGVLQVLPQVMPMVEEAGGVFAAFSSRMSLIGSVADSQAWLYRISKAALNMAIASAQHSYARATLVTLDPGWVRTDMGGDGAPLSVQDSVRGLRRTLAGITPADRGHLLHHDGQRASHW